MLLLIRRIIKDQVISVPFVPSMYLMNISSIDLRDTTVSIDNVVDAVVTILYTKQADHRPQSLPMPWQMVVVFMFHVHVWRSNKVLCDYNATKVVLWISLVPSTRDTLDVTRRRNDRWPHLSVIPSIALNSSEDDHSVKATANIQGFQAICHKDIWVLGGLASVLHCVQSRVIRASQSPLDAAGGRERRPQKH